MSKVWPRRGAAPEAQDIRKINKLENGLIEVLKYATKIFTKEDPLKKKTKRKQRRKLYVAALHEINMAMRGRKLFNKFGFSLPPTVEKPKKETTVLIESENWVYDVERTDWVSVESAKKLILLNSFAF